MRDERRCHAACLTDATGVPVPAPPEIEPLPAPPPGDGRVIARSRAASQRRAAEFTVAMDSPRFSRRGDDARRIEELAQPRGLDSEGLEDIREDARFAAESQERNAWQADGAIDRVILAGLLATIVLAIAAAYSRAAGRRRAVRRAPRPPPRWRRR